MNTFVIYSGSDSNSIANFNHGIVNGIWGFQKVRENAKSDFESIKPGDFVLLGMGFTHPDGGSPRKSTEQYLEGSLRSMVLGEVESNLGTFESSEWPDEVAAKRVIYPFRLKFYPVAQFQNLSLGKLDEEVADAFRLSALRQGEPTFLSQSEIWKTL